MTVVTPYFTFPCISWWHQASLAETVIFDDYEHFQKMTDRNRYDICGSNNRIKLSVPLVNGRNQRVPMKEVLIYNDTQWQVQHWRTIVSVYKRSPYFEHYEDSLKALFENPFKHLVDYNRAALKWVKQQLALTFKEIKADLFVKDYADNITDLRFHKPDVIHFPKYYQVFEDRIGFVEDLSILDLLFSEGPKAVSIVKLQVL